MAIQYIRQKDISFAKWDKCISNSLNGNLYALSWYLEIVGMQWDALIENDYESVMPLIYRRKNLMLEVYAPVLSGQLGVFSKKPVNQKKILEFLNAIPEKFRRVQLFLNRQNSSAYGEISNCSQPVFELDLITSFEKARKNYSEGASNKLRNAEQQRYWVMKHLPVLELENYLNKHSGTINAVYTLLLTRIVVRLIQLNRAEISGVYSPANNLCAVACYVKSNSNVILLFAHSDPEIEHIGAGYLLLNSFLESYSARNVTLSLDFRDNKWSDEFYTDFGALKSFAHCIVLDRRPIPFRWIP